MRRAVSPLLAAIVIPAALGLGGAAYAQSTPSPAPVPDPVTIQTPADVSPTDTVQHVHYRRPIFRIWQSFTLPAGDEIRQIILVLGSARIEGTVRSDVFVWFGNVHLAPTAVVNGSVVVIAGNLTVDPGAAVNRDLVVIGGSTTAPPTFSPGGDHFSVGTPRLGYGLRQVAEWVTRGPLFGRVIVLDLPWIWAALGITFVLSLLINQIFDPPVRAAAQAVQARPLNALLMGLLLIVVIGPALVVLAASVIGLLVVPFAICAVVAGWMIGKVGVTRAIGMRVIHETDPESRAQSLRSFVLGFVIIAAAYAVPVIGLTAWGLVSLFGLGAAGLTFVERRRSTRTTTGATTPGATTDASGIPGSFETAVPLSEDPVAHVVVPAAVPPPTHPAPGATALLPHAAFLDRAAAFAIDCVLMAVAIQVLGQNDDLYLFWLLVYHIAFWIWKATTLGGIICNLRVVRTSGEPLRPTDAVVRGLSSLFSIAALGIGCLWMIRDPNRQTWHDKIAGTYVVKVPHDWPL